jgi:glutathione S-transferase
MTITITAFAASPDRGRGLARDFRVRWALEEAGLPYEVQLLSFEALKQPDYLAQQPFGQIPAYREDGLILFESGAIVLHIAERHPGLLPADPAARARAISWLFAALNTVEPPIVERSMALMLEGDRPWAAERMAMLDANVAKCLVQLARHLGDAEWLDGGFSAADLMMVTVLCRLGASELLAAYPALTAYVARGEARPAYQRAFAAQLAVFEASQKAG